MKRRLNVADLQAMRVDCLRVADRLAVAQQGSRSQAGCGRWTGRALAGSEVTYRVGVVEDEDDLTRARPVSPLGLTPIC